VSDAVIREAARLSEAGRPYVLATVVTVQRPASARRGDRAVVTLDGGLIGWVGGACSEPIVIREAHRALADGVCRLVRICPPGRDVSADGDVIVAHSMCASEGTVEVMIEPQLPTPLVSVIGDGPAARTLRALVTTIGWRATQELTDRADAVVVATMGRGDEDALTAALAFGTGYIGLVASAKRASSVRAALRARGLAEEALLAIRSPAGLDLGPSTQEEIAVAVLAELVAWRHRGVHADGAGLTADATVEARDPVCGMTVVTVGDAVTYDHAGATFYFCCPGCRARFAEDPMQFIAAA
jgi:xanthine dehydrogenase accessory factor